MEIINARLLQRRVTIRFVRLFAVLAHSESLLIPTVVWTNFYIIQTVQLDVWEIGRIFYFERKHVVNRTETTSYQINFAIQQLLLSLTSVYPRIRRISLWYFNYYGCELNRNAIEIVFLFIRGGFGHVQIVLNLRDTWSNREQYIMYARREDRSMLFPRCPNSFVFHPVWVSGKIQRFLHNT